MGRVNILWPKSKDCKSGIMCIYNVLNQANVNKKLKKIIDVPDIGFVQEYHYVLNMMDPKIAELFGKCIFKFKFIGNEDKEDEETQSYVLVEIKDKKVIESLKIYNIIEKKIIGYFCSN